MMDLDPSPAAAKSAAAKSAAYDFPATAPACSICLDPVIEKGERSVARLACGHEFHLDCIGSAFNAKGAMQCPNCRKVESGQWLFGSAHRVPADFDIDGWVAGDLYDLSYSELLQPFGFQWCPIRGFTQLTSVFEEAESQPISFADHTSVSSGSHVCPYLALHGFFNPMHASSSSAASTDTAASYHHHPSGIERQPTADMNNLQYFPATEPPNHDREQQYIGNFLTSGNREQPMPQYGVGFSRYDNLQQRSRMVAHPHSVLHRNTSHNMANLVAPLGSAAIGESRTHVHSRRNPVYHQYMASSMQNNPFPHARRVRPRALRIASFIAASSSTEMGPHGFSIPGGGSMSGPDSDNLSRHLDPSYRWGREGYTPLPWIPVEGESHWWGPFNPAQNPLPGSVMRRSNTVERIPQHPSESSSYPRMQLPRMPPYQ